MNWHVLNIIIKLLTLIFLLKSSTFKNFLNLYGDVLMNLIQEKCCQTIATVVATFLFATVSYATECELNGVKFLNLSKEQTSVLRESGASCQPTSAKKDIENEFKFGTLGFILLDGKKISYLDLASENAIKLNGKEVEVYGYINYHQESEPFKEWGYRFDFQIFEGEFYESIKSITTTEPQISVLAAPNKLKSYPEPLTDTLASMRKKVFKTLTQARMGKALIRVKGSIKIFSNTGGMYISTEDSVDLIAK